MNNGDIYNLIKFIANKEQRGGYLNIPNLNNELQIKNIILLREKLGLSNSYGVGQPLAPQQTDVTTALSDQTNIFKKKGTLTFTTGVAPLPADYFRYNSIRHDDALEDVDILSGGETGRRLNNPLTPPSASYPVGEFIASSFYIYPITITSADIIYYKTPTVPVFDYYTDAVGNIQYLTVGQVYTLQAGEIGSAGQTAGAEVTSLSVELEWGNDGKIDIAFSILSDLGVNISRGDVVQYSNNKSITGK